MQFAATLPDATFANVALRMHDLAQIFRAWMFGAWISTGIPLVRQPWTAAAVTLAFAALARLMRGVTLFGAVAGTVVCFLLYAGAGPGAFVALVTVFSLAWIATRWGYKQKQKLGTAEKRDGRRASQVLANLGVAAVCAVLHAASGGRAVFLLAMTAALSEAAADTVSSEMGQASGENARLITTWEWVPAGTDGGVSPVGTLAGIAAAVLVSLVCALTGLMPLKWFGLSATAAVGGMIADSYMGATLERRKLLNNDLVNFLGTLVAVAIALLLV
jgi:uncharacterized protein (TIGR00297 family)